MIVLGFDSEYCKFDLDAIGRLVVAYRGRLQASSATANSMNSNRFAYYYVTSLSPSTSNLSFGSYRPFQRFLFINFHSHPGNHKKQAIQRTSLGR